MNYYKISIATSTQKQDLIIALLSELGYDAFEQEEFSLKTYKTENDFDETPLQQLAEQLEFTYKTKLIPNQNWNVLWESNFQPIQINDFCAIRADFHPHFPHVEHEITVNPKMAFGTGHHETTYMMMEQMKQISFQGKKVLDFGCGTGILSILAEKLGANNILALDNDPLSFENTKENMAVNQSSKIKIQLGVLADLKDKGYDIILANINRSVILNTLAHLFQKIKAGGMILFSGILEVDENLLKRKVEQLGFAVLNTEHRGEWICLKVQR